jgi:uncharacterized protein (DUF433 family)
MDNNLIMVDPETLGGTPVFKGTRVPVRSPFDHLEGGDSIEEVLEDFPSVKRQQVIAVLELLATNFFKLHNNVRILLDENLDCRLNRDLPRHEVKSVPLLGWAGLKNAWTGVT